VYQLLLSIVGEDIMIIIKRKLREKLEKTSISLRSRNREATNVEFDGEVGVYRSVREDDEDENFKNSLGLEIVNF